MRIKRGLQLAIVLALTGTGLLILTLFSSPSRAATTPPDPCVYDTIHGWLCVPTTTPPPPTGGGGGGGGGTIIPDPDPTPIIKTNFFTVYVNYYLGQAKTPLKDAKVTYTDNGANRTKVQNTAANGQTTFSLGTTSTSSYSLKAEKTNCTPFTQNYTGQPSGKYIEIILNCNIGKAVVAVDIEPTADTLKPYQVLSKDEILSEVTISPDIKNPVVFNVKRLGNLSASQTINLSLSGSAKLGTDYTITGVSKLNFTKTIKTNENKILLFVVPKALKDGTNIVLTAKAGTGYDVGNPSQAEVKVKGNDKLLISILHPDINEEYKAGEQEKIWWDILKNDQSASQADINNIKSFSLSLAKDGNNFDTLITDSVNKSEVVVNNQYNRFMYDFDNVPCQLSSNAKVKIKAFDNTGKQIAEGISSPFKITYGEIHIVSPQSGQTLKGAEETTVEWEGSCLPEIKTTKVSYTITSVPETNKPNVGVDYSEQLSSYDGIPKDNKMSFTNPVFRNVRANLFVKLYDGNGVEISHSAIPIVFHSDKAKIVDFQRNIIASVGDKVILNWKTDKPKLVNKYEVYCEGDYSSPSLITSQAISANNQQSASFNIDESCDHISYYAKTNHGQRIASDFSIVSKVLPLEVKITAPPKGKINTNISTPVLLNWTVSGDTSKIASQNLEIFDSINLKMLVTKTLLANQRSISLSLFGESMNVIVFITVIDSKNNTIGADSVNYWNSTKNYTFYGVIQNKSGNLISDTIDVTVKDKDLKTTQTQKVRTITPFYISGIKYNFKFEDQIGENVIYSFYSPALNGKSLSNPIRTVVENGKLIYAKSSGVSYLGNQKFALNLYGCSSAREHFDIPSKFQTSYLVYFESCLTDPHSARTKEYLANKIGMFMDDIRGIYKGVTPDIPSIGIITLRASSEGEYSPFLKDIRLNNQYVYDDSDLDLRHVINHEYSHAIDGKRNLSGGSWKETISNALKVKKTCLDSNEYVQIFDYWNSNKEPKGGYSCSTWFEFVSVWGEQNSLHKDKIPGAIAPLDSRRKDIANSLWNLIKKEMR